MSFAGENALTADIEALNTARKMKADGETKEKIYRETGWFEGKDCKWRFEILDDLKNIHLNLLMDKKAAYLYEIYDNPMLYAAYPSLKNVLIKVKKLSNGTMGGQRGR